MESSRKSGAAATLGRKSALERKSKLRASSSHSHHHHHAQEKGGKNVRLAGDAKEENSSAIAINPNEKVTFRKASKVIPGNAGAKLLTTEAHNAVPVTFRSMSLAAIEAADQEAADVAIQLGAMSPQALQIEIEKKHMALERMASVRKSATATSSGTGRQSAAGGGRASGRMSRKSSKGPHAHYGVSKQSMSARATHHFEEGAIPRVGAHAEEEGEENLKKGREGKQLIRFQLPDDETPEDEQRRSTFNQGKRLTGRFTPRDFSGSGSAGNLNFESGPVDLGGSELKKKKKKSGTRFVAAPEEDDEGQRRRRKSEGEWQKITTVKANELHVVTKYRSRHTGLTVVHAKVESPEVYGYFAFRHKVTNDVGLPHILQHMIFQGSRNFPYPGLLAQFGVKCFGSGREASIHSDHSCYMIKTAGKEGFLNLLPIYMDHIFYPTLNEAGYLTEVHHVTGEGSEGGVCYHEMKANEHDPQQTAHWVLMSEIYGPQSGYHYNYGGHARDLRESGTLESVRSFHREFYHPQNCLLVVCGELEAAEVFGGIGGFMGALVKDPQRPLSPQGWENPWKNEGPVSLEGELECVVTYASEREGHCLVRVAIIGPDSTKDVTLATGMDLLVYYLSHGFISPVQQEFVEVEDALASHVTLSKMAHVQSIYTLSFENVPTQRKEEVPVRLRKLLETQQSSGFSPTRMEFIVEHCYKNELHQMEVEAEETIAKAAISDFIYAFDEHPTIFDRRINHCYTIEQFVGQSESFWKRMLGRLLESSWATVFCVASRVHNEEHIVEEEERAKEIVAKMGEIGLKKAGARLRAAIRIQERKVPPEFLEFVKTPSIDSIGFLGIERFANPDWCEDTLCNLYLDDINSNYVYLSVLMDTSELSVEEKKYLVIFAEALLEAPYVDNNQVHYGYEEMIGGLSKDVLKYETFFGIDWGHGSEDSRFSCGSYSHLFCIRFEMEIRKVKEGFEWIQLLLWNTKWQSDRLKIVAQRLSAEVSDLLDHGGVITKAMIAENIYHMDSNVRVMNLVRQQQFLERLVSELPVHFKKVEAMLERIRHVILRPDNTTVHVASRLAKMEFYLTDNPEVTDALPQLLRRTFDYTGWNWGYDTRRLAAEPDYKWMKGVQCIQKCATEQIIKMHSDEFAYLLQVLPCIREYNCGEYPLLLTTIHYFCQQGGPFEKAIKSSGAASAANLILKPHEGMIYFQITGALDLVTAYTSAFDIINSHIQQLSASPSDLVANSKPGSQTVDASALAAAAAKAIIHSEQALEEAEAAAEDAEHVENPKKSIESSSENLWSEDLLQSAKSSAIFELIDRENSPAALATNSLLNHYHKVPGGFGRFVMARILTVTMEEVQGMTQRYLYPLLVKTCTCAVAAPEEKIIEISKGLMEGCGKRLTLLPPVRQSQMGSFV